MAPVSVPLRVDYLEKNAMAARVFQNRAGNEVDK